MQVVDRQTDITEKAECNVFKETGINQVSLSYVCMIKALPTGREGLCDIELYHFLG